MWQSDTVSRQKRRFLKSIIFGLLATALIFLLVPLTQLSHTPRPEAMRIEPITLATQSPPPPPEYTQEQLPPTEVDARPELKQVPPLPTLEQLNLSLNPGVGGDLSAGLGFNFDLGADSATEMMKLFDFDELDEVPRLIREGRFQYPPNSPRGRGLAHVLLLVYIDTKGRVQVQHAIEYSHREFVEAASRMANSSRFSIPMRDGRPVRSSYEWLVRIPFSH
jgi:hypothetical protein